MSVEPVPSSSNPIPAPTEHPAPASASSPTGSPPEVRNPPDAPFVPFVQGPPVAADVAGAAGADEVDLSLLPDAARTQRRPSLCGVAKPGRRLVKKDPEEEAGRRALTPEQRLLVLDSWQRSGLPAEDFAGMVGVSKHTLYSWKKRFATHGPAGLLDQVRGSRKGSRVPETTRRAILMIKQANPDFGCQRISDLLTRGPALPVSASAVSRVLHEAGYQLEEVATRPHPDHPRSFERAKPNQLWQSDLFTFILKRQNRRVYLVAFLDDHSRFIVSYGLHASQSAVLVLEVLRAGLDSYGAPEEVLTDNGSQYVTWRGKSLFSKELEKRGIRHVVAAPRRPQTLGKIERFWGTLWRECVEAAVFLDLEDARRRIGLWLDYYNFQRTHEGIGGLVPADRFFGAESEVRRSLAARVAANALELARHGVPKAPLYLTGQVGGTPFSLHTEGEKVIVTRGEGGRAEIDLKPPAPTPAPAELPTSVCPQAVLPPGVVDSEEPPAPGASPLDGELERIAEALE